MRRAAGSAPALHRAADGAARALSPAFRAGVAVLIVVPRTRRTGLEALVAGVAAGMSARVLRDAIGRRRPGRRADGGFPSRHGAAAAAIARAVHRRNPPLGVVMAVAACAGLAGRVATAQHEPADIAAGAALGLAVERAAAAARRGR